jgi:hypothetical protein
MPPCRTTANRLHSYNGIVGIDVGAGDKRTIFRVHMALLTARSDFFKKALNGKWMEAEEKIVRLPEDDPTVYATYVHHLYTGELVVQPDEQKPVKELLSEQHHMLCSVYVLAEKILDIETKNAVFHAMLEMRYTKQSNGKICGSSCDGVNVIYKGTVVGSPARRLMVDLYSYRVKGDWIGQRPFSKEFLRDLLIRTLDTRIAPCDSTQNQNGSESMEAKEKGSQL